MTRLLAGPTISATLVISVGAKSPSPAAAAAVFPPAESDLATEAAVERKVHVATLSLFLALTTSRVVPRCRKASWGAIQSGGHPGITTPLRVVKFVI